MPHVFNRPFPEAGPGLQAEHGGGCRGKLEHLIGERNNLCVGEGLNGLRPRRGPMPVLVPGSGRHAPPPESRSSAILALNSAELQRLAAQR